MLLVVLVLVLVRVSPSVFLCSCVRVNESCHAWLDDWLNLNYR